MSFQSLLEADGHFDAWVTRFLSSYLYPQEDNHDKDLFVSSLRRVAELVYKDLTQDVEQSLRVMVQLLVFAHAKNPSFQKHNVLALTWRVAQCAEVEPDKRWSFFSEALARDVSSSSAVVYEQVNNGMQTYDAYRFAHHQLRSKFIVTGVETDSEIVQKMFAHLRNKPEGFTVDTLHAFLEDGYGLEVWKTRKGMTHQSFVLGVKYRSPLATVPVAVAVTKASEPAEEQQEQEQVSKASEPEEQQEQVSKEQEQEQEDDTTLLIEDTTPTIATTSLKKKRKVQFARGWKEGGDDKLRSMVEGNTLSSRAWDELAATEFPECTGRQLRAHWTYIKRLAKHAKQRSGIDKEQQEEEEEEDEDDDNDNDNDPDDDDDAEMVTIDLVSEPSLSLLPSPQPCSLPLSLQKPSETPSPVPAPFVPSASMMMPLPRFTPPPPPATEEAQPRKVVVPRPRKQQQQHQDAPEATKETKEAKEAKEEKEEDKKKRGNKRSASELSPDTPLAWPQDTLTDIELKVAHQVANEKGLFYAVWRLRRMWCARSDVWEPESAELRAARCTEDPLPGDVEDAVTNTFARLTRIDDGKTRKDQAATVFLHVLAVVCSVDLLAHNTDTTFPDVCGVAEMRLVQYCTDCRSWRELALAARNDLEKRTFAAGFVDRFQKLLY